MILIIFLTILGLGPLHDAGYQGQGVRVAIIDAGFFRANDSTVFDQSRIRGTYDLLPDSLWHNGLDMFSNPADNHGTKCLSTMLYRSDSFTGTAPDADYYLIRTEDIYHENRAEVDRLIRAFDLADSLDVDVVTVSLGYYQFDDTTTNFTHDSLGGLSRVSQRATTLAQRRMVCIAAGNEGKKPWQKITIPADARDILTVGAVQADSTAAAFSSYGPTADGRLKPEVSAWGQSTMVYAPEQTDSLGNCVGAIIRGNGTSFATPEIAGMCASLQSALPKLSASQLRDRILRSAHLYDTPDDQRGYGIPNAWQVYNVATDTPDPPMERGTYKYLKDGRIVIRRGGVEYSTDGLRFY